MTMPKSKYNFSIDTDSTGFENVKAIKDYKANRDEYDKENDKRKKKRKALDAEFKANYTEG